MIDHKARWEYLRSTLKQLLEATTPPRNQGAHDLLRLTIDLMDQADETEDLEQMRLETEVAIRALAFLFN